LPPENAVVVIDVQDLDRGFADLSPTNSSNRAFDFSNAMKLFNP